MRPLLHWSQLVLFPALASRCSRWPGVVLQLLQRSTFPLYTMASQPEGDPNDASDMLAAALEQMDDIIAEVKAKKSRIYEGAGLYFCFNHL
ncbi:hypothetical protein BSL78_19845 [Apostichopus japonicus]|uniref:Uncharacterized protein n=1 Tax=Stichopus japonicus TaxID=307972 RepID=A0A2G8K5P6_STIJA|nr:hypothetical protein BSL78_19845 [Apostichopus japonicus]